MEAAVQVGEGKAGGSDGPLGSLEMVPWPVVVVHWCARLLRPRRGRGDGARQRHGGRGRDAGTWDFWSLVEP